ncbi:MAG: diacylglycerol kinase family lipid kinase [Deltaproteobacteria bacterium]|nr:diacylglycerol kinase family lipid kinase [Deltaproteobacteria bacterium]
MKTLLIVNPAARHGRGRKCYDRISPRLNEKIPGLEVRMSEYSGHAVEIGRQAAQEEYDRILCLGGDGTSFEVINGLYSEGRPPRLPEIGLIPAGTGNSFIRDFGTVTEEQAIDNILSGRRRQVDLVEIHYQAGDKTVRRYSLNIVGIGLIADILRLTNQRLKFLGAAGYSLAVLIRLAKGMKNRIDISTKENSRTVMNSALVLSNSKYTGGNMMIAPNADVSNGRVDLVLFNQVNRRDIISIFSRVFSGTHLKHPKVLSLQSETISVIGDPPLLLMADGELLGHTPLQLKVHPKELTILT